MSTEEIQFMNQKLAKVNERLAALEWNVQRALAAVNLQWEQPVVDTGIPADIVALVRDGNKLQAIKRYREISGCGLAEATAVIEGI